MRIGAAVFLLAVGAILTFAVRDNIQGVDLGAVGWILMVAGAVGIALTAALRGSRRTETVIDARGPVIGSGVTRQEVREDLV